MHNQPEEQPPAGWQRLVPQNRQRHWVISDSGDESLPYRITSKPNIGRETTRGLLGGAWAVIIWNRREECHYELTLGSGKITRACKPWDNSAGWGFTHVSDIAEQIVRTDDGRTPPNPIPLTEEEEDDARAAQADRYDELEGGESYT